jgi:hypothetical protein
MRAVAAASDHVLLGARAVDDAADREPADEVGVVEVEHQHLERRRGRSAAPGWCDDLLEQRLQPWFSPSG